MPVVRDKAIRKLKQLKRKRKCLGKNSSSIKAEDSRDEVASASTGVPQEPRVEDEDRDEDQQSASKRTKVEGEPGTGQKSMSMLIATFSYK